MLARGKTLVICPKTQWEDMNWEREANKLHDIKSKQGLHISMPDVISKETFRRDAHKLDSYDTVIVDEAHTCLGVTPMTRQRNKVQIPRTSQLYEALRLYIVTTRPKRVYLCTATIIKSPMTVWGASELLGGFNWNFYEFRSTFYTPIKMGYRQIWIPKSDNETKERLAKAVHKLGYVGRLEDFFDVPDQTYRTIHVPLTKQQKERIADMRTEYPEPIVRLGKVHQIENGVLKGDEFSESEVINDNKLRALDDLQTEFPKMIVFVKYTEQIKKIYNYFAEKYNQEAYLYTMTGETKDRGELLKHINSQDSYIFIVQAQISTGWELPNCPVMVFASRTYSYVDYAQAQGRILRANNLKKNLYINLVCKGHTDEAVDKALSNKESFNEQLYVEGVR